MQNFSRGLCLLNEFYNRHKSLIDALAKDDEMFRAVKEIAETKGQPLFRHRNGMIAWH